LFFRKKRIDGSDLKKKRSCSNMRVVVDKAACVGCARCVRTCPDLFTQDEKLKAVVLVETVPPQSELCAKAAALICPVSAITIEQAEV
jgi:ferredoxin